MTRQAELDTRHQAAHDAWARLPHGGREAVRLRVTCGASHHVATVYRTDAGLVYSAPLRGHSHGDRDRVDQPHRAQEIDLWFDWLAPDDAGMVDDAVPAWCDCGHRMLSRAAMLEWMDRGERRVVVH